MSFRIIRAAISAEKNDYLHEARLILLLLHISERGSKGIDGITKLAKLDFLLRYPMYLERLLPKIRKKEIKLPIKEHERDTVESKMIRYKYGPWDPRYRGWISILVAKGLAETFLAGRTVHVCLTNKGKKIAYNLRQQEEFGDVNSRCEIIAKTAGKLSGTRLKNVVYEVVPELTGMAWGEDIEP